MKIIITTRKKINNGAYLHYFQIKKWFMDTKYFVNIYSTHTLGLSLLQHTVRKLVASVTENVFILLHTLFSTFSHTIIFVILFIYLFLIPPPTYVSKILFIPSLYVGLYRRHFITPRWITCYWAIVSTSTNWTSKSNV